MSEGVELVKHCPLCDWSAKVKIPAEDVNRESLKGRPSLSWEREQRILEMWRKGKSYREISATLEISYPTVQKYCSRKKTLIDAKKELQNRLLRHLETHNQQTW